MAYGVFLTLIKIPSLFLTQFINIHLYTFANIFMLSSLSLNFSGFQDLLAVGYGHFGFKEQKRGLACCWSIKNPMVTRAGIRSIFI